MDIHHRRLLAVRVNDVTTLINLSDKSKWYKATWSKTGNTFLHIAVLNRRKEAFDYLLSFPDSPLNQKNHKGKTPLNLCLDGWSNTASDYSGDYFARELIQRGASVNCIKLKRNETLLHYTIWKQYAKVSKLLVQKGYDVNARNAEGVTPLQLYFNSFINIEDELPITLLFHGADISLGQNCINAFEHAVKQQHTTLQEKLFHFTFDDYTQIDIHFDVLLILAENRSPLFLDTLNHAKNVIVSSYVHWFKYWKLFYIDQSYLEILIGRCLDAIRRLFWQLPREICDVSYLYNKKYWGNISLLLESGVRQETIIFLNNFNINSLNFSKLMDESAALEYVCLLLSHGQRLNECFLIRIYEKYGFGELLRIALNMEIDSCSPKMPITNAYFLLIYDVHCDLEKILNQPHLEDVSQLVHYFSDPKLRTICQRDKTPKTVAAAARQSQIKLLLEISRDAFRKALISRFKVSTAKEFYTLVSRLAIVPSYKEIITFQQKIYL